MSKRGISFLFALLMISSVFLGISMVTTPTSLNEKTTIVPSGGKDNIKNSLRIFNYDDAYILIENSTILGTVEIGAYSVVRFRNVTFGTMGPALIFISEQAEVYFEDVKFMYDLILVATGNARIFFDQVDVSGGVKLNASDNAFVSFKNLTAMGYSLIMMWNESTIEIDNYMLQGPTDVYTYDDSDLTLRNLILLDDLNIISYSNGTLLLENIDSDFMVYPIMYAGSLIINDVNTEYLYVDTYGNATATISNCVIGTEFWPSAYSSSTMNVENVETTDFEQDVLDYAIVFIKDIKATNDIIVYADDYGVIDIINITAAKLYVDGYSYSQITIANATGSTASYINLYDLAFLNLINSNVTTVNCYAVSDVSMVLPGLYGAYAIVENSNISTFHSESIETSYIYNSEIYQLSYLVVYEGNVFVKGDSITADTSTANVIYDAATNVAFSSSLTSYIIFMNANVEINETQTKDIKYVIVNSTGVIYDRETVADLWILFSDIVIENSSMPYSLYVVDSTLSIKNTSISTTSNNVYIYGSSATLEDTNISASTIIMDNSSITIVNSSSSISAEDIYISTHSNVHAKNVTFQINNIFYIDWSFVHFENVTLNTNMMLIGSSNVNFTDSTTVTSASGLSAYDSDILFDNSSFETYAISNIIITNSRVRLYNATFTMSVYLLLEDSEFIADDSTMDQLYLNRTDVTVLSSTVKYEVIADDVVGVFMNSEFNMTAYDGCDILIEDSTVYELELKYVGLLTGTFTLNSSGVYGSGTIIIPVTLTNTTVNSLSIEELDVYDSQVTIEGIGVGMAIVNMSTVVIDSSFVGLILSDSCYVTVVDSFIMEFKSRNSVIEIYGSTISEMEFMMIEGDNPFEITTDTYINDSNIDRIDIYTRGSVYINNSIIDALSGLLATIVVNNSGINMLYQSYIFNGSGSVEKNTPSGHYYTNITVENSIVNYTLVGAVVGYAGTVNIKNSTFPVVVALNTSTMDIYNCTVYVIYADDDAKVLVNSTVIPTTTTGIRAFGNANVTLINTTMTFIINFTEGEEWPPYLIAGDNATVLLRNCTIDVASGWALGIGIGGLIAFGNARVTFDNSSVTIDGFGFMSLGDNATLAFINNSSYAVIGLMGADMVNVTGSATLMFNRSFYFVGGFGGMSFMIISENANVIYKDSLIIPFGFSAFSYTVVANQSQMIIDNTTYIAGYDYGMIGVALVNEGKLIANHLNVTNTNGTFAMITMDDSVIEIYNSIVDGQILIGDRGQVYVVNNETFVNSSLYIFGGVDVEFTDEGPVPINVTYEPQYLYVSNAAVNAIMVGGNVTAELYNVSTNSGTDGPYNVVLYYDVVSIYAENLTAFALAPMRFDDPYHAISAVREKELSVILKNSTILGVPYDYIIEGDGSVTFDNGDITKTAGVSLYLLNEYYNCDFAMLMFNFTNIYLTGIVNAKIVNYADSNLIGALALYRTTEFVPPTILANATAIEYETDMTAPIVQFVITEDHPDYYELLLNGTVIESGAYTTGKVVTFDPNTQLPSDGFFQLVLWANDTEGNFDSKTVEITRYPAESPVITDAPPSMIWGNETPVPLSWTAEDLFPDNYTLYVNGTKEVEDSWSSGVAVTYNLDKTDGVYNVTILFYDEAGHFNKSTVFVHIDTMAPVINVTSIDDAFELGETDAFLEFNITEDNPAYYQFIVDGNVVINETYASGEHISINLTEYLTTSGNHTIRIVAYDEAGGSSSYTHTVEVYPAEAPEIVVGPEDEYTVDVNETLELVWNVVDSTPSYYEIYVNGTLVANGTWTSGVNITYSFVEDEAGTYVIEIRLYDEAGHMTTDTVIVTVEAAVSPPPSPGPTIDMITIGIIIGAIVVIIVIVIMRRR